MIRIKVLKIDKWIYVLLFIVLILLVAAALRNAMADFSAVEVFSQQAPKDTISTDMNSLFRGILDRAFPALKLVSEGEQVKGGSFLEGIIDHFMRLNYRDPRSFIAAELSIMNYYDMTANRGSSSQLNRNSPYDPENDIQDILAQYDLDNVEINMQHYTDTVQTLNVQKPEKTTMDMSKPVVLIYHTHTSEAYKPSVRYNYTPTDVDRTIDPRYSVVRVGRELKDVLEEQYGIKVIHDTTFHDYPDYGPSYSSSLRTLKKLLSEHTSLKVLLDIHRDAFPMRNDSEIAKARETSTIKINGQNVSRLMLVWGPDSENSEETRKFAALMNNIINRQYPGLCRKVMEKESGKYNQHLSNYSALIEVGSNSNTMEEALRSVPYLAKAIAEAIKEIGE